MINNSDSKRCVIVGALLQDKKPMPLMNTLPFPTTALLQGRPHAVVSAHG